MEKLGMAAVGSGMTLPLGSSKVTSTTLIGLVLYGLPMPDMTKEKGVFAGRGELTKLKPAVTLPFGTVI